MWSDVKYRLRALFRRSAVERELDEELRFHIEREIEKRVRAGMPRAEAARQVQIEFGGLEQIREDTRAVRGVAGIEALLQDVRYAWRGVKTRPGFTAAVVLTLGLGIGANVAMFGVVDRLLVRPPSGLSAPERVHRVYWTYTWDGSERTERNFEYLRYRDVSRFASSFDALAAFGYRRLPVGRGADARELMIAPVSASFFDFFDVQPVLGRFYGSREDAVPEGQKVAVLGHAFWQSEYGGRRDVLGEQLYIGDAYYTIVGVAPRGFVGITDGAAPVAFVPITAYAHTRGRDYAENYTWSWVEIAARRKPGVSVSSATTDLSAAFVRSWEAQREQDDYLPAATVARPHGTISPVSLARGPDAGPEARIATWVLGVAFIVLLIASANVINLLLARALHRSREIALRLALGVSRARLLQQLLTETVLLALMGGAAGLAAAQWGGGMLRALFLPPDEPIAVAGDTRTVLFAGALTLVIALLTGLAPALQALRADVGSALKAGMVQSAYRSSTLRTGLLLFQGALSVVLLVGAGLFVRSLQNVRALRLGYDREPTLYVEANLRGVEDERGSERDAVADRLLAAATTVPGVQSATLTVSVPFYGSEGRGPPRVPGRDSLNLLGRFTLQAGSPEYFETVGTRILRGRGFTSADAAGAQPVIIVSEAMADALWPAQDPLGKQLRFGNDTMPMLTVVGVAENITARQIGGAAREFWYYLPIEQLRARYGGARRPSLFVRVDGRAEDYLQPVRARLQRELSGDAYVTTVPLAELIAPQQRSWRLGATMFLVFAALALILATIGLYSVTAYEVAQRTRELGLRIALGARVADVLRLIVGQGALFAFIGIAAGSGAALFAARWVEPLLFSVSAKDPLVYGCVAGVLLVVALAATVRPALRAARVDPTIALRSE